MIRRTIRGQMVDVDLLMQQNKNTIAVGNASLNARGDQIGRGGKVVKTAEQIDAETIYKSSTMEVSTKGDVADMTFETPEQAIANLRAAKELADQEAVQTRTKKRADR